MVFPICPMVMSNKAKEVGNRGLWNTSKFETNNGHEWGAIWSNRDETRPRLQEISRRIFLDGAHGA